MNSKFPHKRNLLCAAISLSLLPIANSGFAQDDGIEEVVVTGSYIRRSEGFTQASQVTQLSAEDLANEGTLNLGEVVQNLSFVNGPGSAITNTIQGTDSRSTQFDLRGLGTRSTLTLMDGKRIVNQNVNSMLPTIAIQRMDIVADGAAALYGNEAVAGVVNFVPYKSYDGLKIDTFGEGDERGDYGEHSVQVLWGTDIGGLDIVLAGQFRQNERLEWAERPRLSQSGLTMSSNAPGNWRVPTRDANGEYTGDFTNAIDPNCGLREGFVPGQITTAFGAARGNTCMFEYGDNRDYRAPTSTNQFYANAAYDVSDDLSLNFQYVQNRLYEWTGTSTSNPGGTTRIGQLPSIRGEIPGNPFRAVNGSGQPLFGFDRDGNGIPDRNTGVDLNNDGWDDYLVSGTSLPAMYGIPLMEDIRARRLRPINKTMGNDFTPSVVLPSHTQDMDNYNPTTDRNHRWSMEATFTVPFIEGWEGTAGYTSNYRELDFVSNQNYDISAMIQGLNCDVATDRESCYSPFFVTDPNDATQAHVLLDIMARDREQVRDELDTIDLVLNGEIGLGGFELPGGPIGAAIGYQFRDDSFINTPAAVEIAGDAWIGGTEKEDITTGNRTVDSYFAELSVPVLPNLEVQAAVRREEFSTGQTSTDPKFGVTWAATDWLTFRATDGDAFIAPTLEQLYNPVTCGLGTVTDRFGPFSAFTTQCGGGNPNLENESAESQQFGFDIVLGDFDISVTYNHTEFVNRIVSTSAQTINEIDFIAFKAWSGFTGDGYTPATQPSKDQLTSWYNSGNADPRIVRSPDDIYDIISLTTGASNAETVEVTAYDIQSNYRFTLDNWGDFRIGLQATLMDEFLYQEDPTQPIIDGAGLYNDKTNAAPNLPEWKANLQMGWTRGDHSINAIGRYYSDMPYDGPTYGLLAQLDNQYYPSRTITDGEVRAWTQVDASYTYRGVEAFGGAVAFSLGARNLFDRQAQSSPEFAGVIGQLQDPMGRTFYARVVYDF
ncbi:MAG: TonB-dependent receptor [Gammaproteobacteria bacterium]|nr:TonB-dependent receptor [Gammaproteobacteria bacterium]